MSFSLTFCFLTFYETPFLPISAGLISRMIDNTHFDNIWENR